MTKPFDAHAIAKLGWRQGAILGSKLAKLARNHAPETVPTPEGGWLVVCSHDCDIVSPNLEKEPVVEVLRASATTSRKTDRQKSGGRNPRNIELSVDLGTGPTLLSLAVHDRWSIPRSLLLEEKPKGHLPRPESRLVAEWLAKRYIRAAFPTAFDERWRAKRRNWERLLRKHSDWIQGVYLRLSTLNELPEDEAYKCHLILAVPHVRRGGAAWAMKRRELESAVTRFWEQFEPGIQCVEVEPLGTDEISLADIEPYQRFDADWVSFEDDTPTTPAAADMTS